MAPPPIPLPLLLLLLGVVPITAGENRNAASSSKQAVCWNCVSESMAFLRAHNLVRTAHYEPPLIWDNRLAARARWWASQRRRDCRLVHSFSPGAFVLGENIFWGGGSAWTPADAVNDWAAEEKYYSYRSNSCVAGEECGHYTQLIWRDTWRVGCARELCDDGDVFIVCNYDPPGNVVGRRPY